MENKPLVSVIMNCYNSDTYLREAIESVISQTYENWEIIFWDNQSTDKSAEIVKSYNDKRIKYFYAPNHTSLGEGRNKAMEKVEGEFISFLDCDDLYLPSKIAQTLTFFNDGVGLVYTNGYTLFEDRGIKSPFYNQKQNSGSLFQSWFSSYQIMIPSVMFRRKVLTNLDHYFDHRFNMIEEFDFFMRIAKTWKINYCHTILCAWRAHSRSLTWKQKSFFESENKLFLKDMLYKNPEISGTSYVKKFEAKIAYQEFYNSWKQGNEPKRFLLIPHMLLEKRLFFVYILSFFGICLFNKLLKHLGKHV